MNKKANAGNLVLWIMLGIFFYAVIVSMLSSIKSVTDWARSQLNCSAAGLSTGIQMVCIQIDLFLFLFVALGFGMIWYLISGKKKIENP